MRKNPSASGMVAARTHAPTRAVKSNKDWAATKHTTASVLTCEMSEATPMGPLISYNDNSVTRGFSLSSKDRGCPIPPEQDTRVVIRDSSTECMSSTAQAGLCCARRNLGPEKKRTSSSEHGNLDGGGGGGRESTTSGNGLSGSKHNETDERDEG